MLGPMKAYSTRSTERTIKKFSNLIAGKTKTGINASNLLLKLTNYNSNLIKQLEEDTKRLDMADTYNSTYISHQSGCKDSPQFYGSLQIRKRSALMLNCRNNIKKNNILISFSTVIKKIKSDSKVYLRSKMWLLLYV